jgi:hypothetical protein
MQVPKYYATYYEESPAFRPEEGGYYYAVVEAVHFTECYDYNEAVENLKLYAEEFDLKHIDGEDFAIDRSKYIGESSYAFIETDRNFKCRESGVQEYC